MICKHAAGLGMALGLFLAASPALAWPLGAPLYTNRYDLPPSMYGYDLDNRNPGYYGGSRYREFYNFGRGYGLANYPGPVPNYPYATRGFPAYNPQPHPEPAVRAADFVAYLDVKVPEDAQVWLEGKPTRQTGSDRLYVSPPLEPGPTFTYEIRARWLENGHAIEQTQSVDVRAGSRVSVQFPAGKSEPTLPRPKPFPVEE